MIYITGMQHIRQKYLLHSVQCAKLSFPPSSRKPGTQARYIEPVALELVAAIYC